MHTFSNSQLISRKKKLTCTVSFLSNDSAIADGHALCLQTGPPKALLNKNATEAPDPAPVLKSSPPSEPSKTDGVAIHSSFGTVGSVDTTCAGSNKPFRAGKRFFFFKTDPPPFNLGDFP